MTDRTMPGFSIRRTVSPDIAENWQGKLDLALKAEGRFDYEDIRRVLRPAQKLGITLIKERELYRLHERLGLTPDKIELYNLGQYVLEQVPESAHSDLLLSVQPVTLVPVNRPGKSRQGRGLVVASSQATLFKERQAAREAVNEYYGLRSSPESVWSDDRRVVAGGIQVARANNVRQLSLLEVLMERINRPGRGILGETVSLQPLRPSPIE